MEDIQILSQLPLSIASNRTETCSFGKHMRPSLDSQKQYRASPSQPRYLRYAMSDDVNIWAAVFRVPRRYRGRQVHLALEKNNDGIRSQCVPAGRTFNSEKNLITRQLLFFMSRDRLAEKRAFKKPLNVCLNMLECLATAGNQTYAA